MKYNHSWQCTTNSISQATGLGMLSPQTHTRGYFHSSTQYNTEKTEPAEVLQAAVNNLLFFITVNWPTQNPSLISVYYIETV